MYNIHVLYSFKDIHQLFFKIDYPIRFLQSCPLTNFWSKERGWYIDSKSTNMQGHIPQLQQFPCCGKSFTSSTENSVKPPEQSQLNCSFISPQFIPGLIILQFKLQFLILLSRWRCRPVFLYLDLWSYTIGLLTCIRGYKLDHSINYRLSWYHYLLSEWTLFLSSVALISNIGLLTSDALTGEPNEKEPIFNKEPSPDIDEVTVLELIPPPNGDWDLKVISG